LGGGAVAVSGAPQSPQKRLPAATSAPQDIGSAARPAAGSVRAAPDRARLSLRQGLTASLGRGVRRSQACLTKDEVAGFFRCLLGFPGLLCLAVMPTIAVVNGIMIAMYYNDHDPPHFHAIHAGNELLVEIIGPRILARRGRFPAAMEHMVLFWAAPRQAALAVCWARAHSAIPPGRIP
jgi:hypothetical protein